MKMLLHCIHSSGLLHKSTIDESRPPLKEMLSGTSDLSLMFVASIIKSLILSSDIYISFFGTGAQYCFILNLLSLIDIIFPGGTLKTLL